jgi:tRNA/rRNA methyltransferase
MRPTMVRNIRAMFGRASLTDQEVRTLHGILTELVTKRLKS